MKQLLLDQGLPASAAKYLAEEGISAEHVSKLGMASASDSEILDYAVKNSAIIATLDSDFHSLLAIANSQAPSVIRIRIEGLKGYDIAKLIKQVVLSAAPEIDHGAAITVTERGIRVRKLPLI